MLRDRTADRGLTAMNRFGDFAVRAAFEGEAQNFGGAPLPRGLPLIHGPIAVVEGDGIAVAAVGFRNPVAGIRKFGPIL